MPTSSNLDFRFRGATAALGRWRGRGRTLRCAQAARGGGGWFAVSPRQGDADASPPAARPGTHGAGRRWASSSSASYRRRARWTHPVVTHSRRNRSVNVVYRTRRVGSASVPLGEWQLQWAPDRPVARVTARRLGFHVPCCIWFLRNPHERFGHESRASVESVELS